MSTALKNAALYPPTHPRAGTAAATALQLLQKRADALQDVHLKVQDGVITVDGREMPSDAYAQWLVKRFLDVGLRGLVFDATCTAQDLVDFAAALNRCRGRDRTALLTFWPLDHARLRPEPLVFSGRHGGPNGAEAGGEGDGGSGDAAAVDDPGLAVAAGPRHLRPLLHQLSTDADIQARLRAIEESCTASSDGNSRDVDLLGAIAAILPAEVANDPVQMEASARRILELVEEQLADLVRRDAKVEGAELLRLALAVAPKYFRSQGPRALTTPQQPSGRPEDDRIAASFELLQQEIAALPHALDLELDGNYGIHDWPTGRELAGVCLYAIANSSDPAILRGAERQLARLVTCHGDRLIETCEAYLPGRDGKTTPSVPHAQVFRSLVEAGLGPALRQRGHIDVQFLTRGFPESLPVAARVLGDDAAGRAVLRQGLEALGKMLQFGGMELVAQSGVLAQDAVVTALVRIGGSVVLPFLPHAATTGSPAVRQSLLTYALTLPLPAGEAVALRSVPAVDDLPPGYLQQVLTACVQRKFDGPLREATARLLRGIVERGRDKLAHDAYLDAIGNLRHAPEPESIELLRRLASEGRFTQFGRAEREIRARARETLAVLGTGRAGIRA